MNEQKNNNNTLENASQDMAKNVCAVCGRLMTDDERFCINCGTPSNTMAQETQPVIEPLFVSDGKKQKRRKIIKRLLIGLAAVVAVVGIIFGVRAAFLAIRNSIGMSKNETIVEDYRIEEIDYEKAVSEISKLKESKDYEVASGAAKAEEKIEEFKKSKDHFAKGNTYKNKKDYTNAVHHFSAVIEGDSNYSTAQNEISAIIPLWKETLPAEIDLLLKEGNKEEALDLIETFMSYETDDSINNIKLFIEAEDYLEKGYLNSANAIYKKLPGSLKVNGITVKSRLNKLSKYSAFLAMCGKWQTTKYYLETKEDWDYGSDYWWYKDGDTASRYLTVTCKINDNGSVTVRGNVEFVSYTNYSSIASNLNAKVFESDFSKKLKASDKTFSMNFSTGAFTRGSTSLNDKQKISFDGKIFTHTFSVRYIYSRSCDEVLSSNETFGKRIEKY